ncbi:MAG: GrpB family protein [Candidatus Paceibacterota bacterium]
MTVSKPDQQFSLHPYTTNWKRRYQQAEKKIRSALNESIEIHHIGSTSIPGLLSKPEIDIAIGVDDLAIVKDWVTKFADISYLYYPRFEKETPNRRYFRKGNRKRPLVHVHIYKKSDPVFKDMIVFRDTLLQNTKLRDQYAAIKKKLAKSTKFEWMPYMEAKYEFIKKVVAEEKKKH